MPVGRRRLKSHAFAEVPVHLADGEWEVDLLRLFRSREIEVDEVPGVDVVLPGFAKAGLRIAEPILGKRCTVNQQRPLE
jgi:hypothetical protein